MNIKAVEKSEYIGVYKKPRGSKPWITFLRFGELSFSINSRTERTAAAKYDILARFFHWTSPTLKLNGIDIANDEYRKIAKELYQQLSLPTSIQKSVSNQGYKKRLDASTAYVGVYKYKDKELYQAYIAKDSKQYRLGYYKSPELAGCAYNIAAGVLYGQEAKLNDVCMDNLEQEFIDKVLSMIK